MLADPLYHVVHTGAMVVALAALILFVGTYLRQVRRYRHLLRLTSVAAAGSALGVVLFVSSPLEYHASAPTPPGTKLYVLSAGNDLFTLRAADGSRTFIRHLLGPQLQLLYLADGQLILAGPEQSLSAGTAANASAVVSSEFWTHTLRAVRADGGQDVLPTLGALTNVTAETLAQGVLYVTAIDTPAHPEAETLSAFSLRPDAPLWRRVLTAPAPELPQFCGSDGGVLYMLLGTSVAAVRSGDGAVLWQSAPLWHQAPPVHINACLAQAGGVYVEGGGGVSAQEGALIKLSGSDGKPLWKLPGMVVESIAGERLYGIPDSSVNTTVNTSVVVFRTSDGAQIGALPGIAVRPADTSFFTSSAGVLYLVGHGTSPRVQLFETCEVFAIRLSDGASLWHRTPQVCAYAHALRAAGGILYLMTVDGDLTAFRAADGGVLWTHTGYRRGGMFMHWSDTFAVSAVGPGVLFVDSNHDGPCQFLVAGCDPENGQYLQALDPATGTRFWRYRSDQIDSYLLAAGSDSIPLLNSI